MKKRWPFQLTGLVLLISVSVIFTSCKDDDPSPSQQATNAENEHVNDWILENMQYWYLWNDNLAAGKDKNQAPEDYFKSILYSGDRFSWIQDNYKELLNSLKGVNKEAGYEFVLYKDKENLNNVIAQVVYIKPNSPAQAAGLVRGDVITHINDTQLTVANYQDMLKKIKDPHTIKYKSVNVEAETFSEPKTLSLNTVEYSEDPSFMHKTFDINDRKIGYYVYNLFAGGPNSNSTVYDDEMDQVFGDFKAQGITDLILDLRFNTGGAETSAVNLSSLIGNGVNSNKVFAKREYNTGVTDVIKKDASLGEDFLTKKFSTKANNIGGQLRDNRVYILTSHRSASASELVINSLKPYMDVFIIGDTTYGKNVGSISLYDDKDTKNTWGMQPIVVKIYNSLGQSDYTKGFVPNVIQKDNRLFVYPLGDEREVLLAHAIGQITGTETAGRATTHGDEKEIIGHSLDAKRRSFNLIIDDFPKK
jgi:carboxyl-terminal processing protease